MVKRPHPVDGRIEAVILDIMVKYNFTGICSSTDYELQLDRLCGLIAPLLDGTTEVPPNTWRKVDTALRAMAKNEMESYDADAYALDQAWLSNNPSAYASALEDICLHRTTVDALSLHAARQDTYIPWNHDRIITHAHVVNALKEMREMHVPDLGLRGAASTRRPPGAGWSL